MAAFGTSCVVMANKFNLPFPKNGTSGLPSSRVSVASELGFISSQLSGHKIPYHVSPKLAAPAASAPLLPALRPVARTFWESTGKKANEASKGSLSNHKIPSATELIKELRHMEEINSDRDLLYRCCTMCHSEKFRETFAAFRDDRAELVGWLQFTACNPNPSDEGDTP